MPTRYTNPDSRRSLADLALISALVLALALIAAAPAIAADPAPPTVAVDPPADAERDLPWWQNPDDAGLTPLMKDLKQVWLTHLEALADLERRRDTAPDEAAALEAQRAIEQHQRDLEVSLLTVQLEHARQEGRLEDVQKLEEAVRLTESPPSLKTEVERARPDDIRR